MPRHLAALGRLVSLGGVCLLATTASAQQPQAPAQPPQTPPRSPYQEAGQLPARIMSFTAEPSAIKPGESVTLKWAVENPRTTTIEPAIGRAVPLGELRVTPSATTTYTLTVTVANVIPTVSATAADVTTAGGTQHTVAVSYGDDVGINSSSLGTADIAVSGPGGSLSVIAYSATCGAKSCAVDYFCTPPGGSWDVTDNGTYTISMAANQVYDSDAAPHAVPAGVIGSFTVNIPSPVTATVGGGGTICAGESAQISAALTGTPPWTLQWSDLVSQTVSASPATRTVSPTTNATYSVTSVTDAVGAGVPGGSATVEVNPLPASFDVTGGGTSCTGASVWLSGSETGVSYQLYRDGSTPVGGPVGGTGGSLDFGNQGTAGAYTVSATNPATSCTAPMKGSATVGSAELVIEMTCPADKQLACGESTEPSNTGSATASANCGDSPTVTYTDTPTAAGCAGVAGIARTWTATVGTQSKSCVQHIEFTDTTAPTIAGFTSSVATLWPPNHTMRDVTIDYSASDACNGAVTTALTVSSNEPLNGTGDGDSSPDWEIVDNHHVRLRAERAGAGGGRVYLVTVTATDRCGNQSSSAAAVVVAHNITGPTQGAAFKINTPVDFTGTFWDVAGSRHTAQWTFDNVSASGTLIEPVRLKAGTVSGRYTFNTAGVYKVTLNLTDQRGARTWVNTAGDMDAVAVIYDPSAGYTVGSGWFPSPAGAYPANSALTGKVSFGFATKYFKNATNPKGEAWFEFKLAGLEFSALNFDYLVIAGAKAQFRGFGKLNGNAGYDFTLTVIDGQISGGGGADKLRLKIWEKNTGVVVYDNQRGAGDADNPAVAVASGSNIVIKTTTVIGTTVGPSALAAEAEGAAATEGQDVDSRAALRPTAFALSPSRPNPFRASTEFQYALPEEARVELSLYDVTGQRVKVLADAIQAAGFKSVRVNGCELGPGVYFLRMRATSIGGRQFAQTRKLQVIR